MVSCVDELSIGQDGSVDDHLGHFLSWHTRDGVAADLLRVLTPLIHSLIHNTVVLTLHTLGSLALAFLTEEHDRVLRALSEVDLDAVEGVLHGLDGHVVFP